MQAPRRYKQAPIVEAILDLKVTVPGTTTPDTLLQIQERVREDYPIIEPLLTGSIIIQPGVSMSVGATQQHSGYRFRSQDGIRVFQATLSGFTCNRLRPYDAWEEFRDEARRLWDIYREACQPIAVTRAALRYINRLELPSSLHDFPVRFMTFKTICGQP